MCGARTIFKHVYKSNLAIILLCMYMNLKHRRRRQGFSSLQQGKKEELFFFSLLPSIIGTVQVLLFFLLSRALLSSWLLLQLHYCPFSNCLQTRLLCCIDVKPTRFQTIAASHNDYLAPALDAWSSKKKL